MNSIVIAFCIWVAILRTNADVIAPTTDDFTYSNGASADYAASVRSIRSGNPHQTTSATSNNVFTAVKNIDIIQINYRYSCGYDKIPGQGAGAKLILEETNGQRLFSEWINGGTPLDDPQYWWHGHTPFGSEANYSPVKTSTFSNLRLNTNGKSVRFKIEFVNNGRNVHFLENDLSIVYIYEPRLKYDFTNGGLKEVTRGETRYDLVLKMGATINNGELQCNSPGYATITQNFDFPVGSHSLEALVKINNLNSRGGGVVTIDGIYGAGEDGYTCCPNDYKRVRFDSILYNWDNNKKWMLGSEWHRRTDRVGGVTVENTANKYIHLVATYDRETKKAMLYRNGEIEQDLNAKNFNQIKKIFDAQANEGIRMMFCERHYNAGMESFGGSIRMGALYDSALAGEQVSTLFNSYLVTITGQLYERKRSDKLLPNEGLKTGQALLSKNGKYAALMEYSGSLSVYDLSNNNRLWTTNTPGAGERTALFRGDDGNFVIYGANFVIWHIYARTHSYARPQYAGKVLMRNDGLLVVYDIHNNPRWDFRSYPNAKSVTFNYLDGILSDGKGNSLQVGSYVMGFIVVLLFVNIVCFVMYFCGKKGRNNNKYQAVNIESSEAETDIEKN